MFDQKRSNNLNQVNLIHQSKYLVGDCEYPSAVVIPYDWTKGMMWKWPILGETILNAYPNFEPMASWNPNWYLVEGTGLYPDDCVD